MNLSTDFFILRTPFYPFSELHKDKSNINELLNPFFKEALFLASPDLYDRLTVVLEGSQLEKYPEVVASILRYLLRMSYRCTPFGLFAGVTVGRIGISTRIEIQDRSNYKKHTRFDSHFLSSIVNNLLSENAVREEIKWYPNNTLYKVGDQLRYVELKLSKQQRNHNLSSVMYSEYLQTILDASKNGVTIHELIECLHNDEISVDEADSFIKEIIQNQILLPELNIQATGNEYHQQLVSKLPNYPSAKIFYEKLNQLVKGLEEIDKIGPGANVFLYKGIFDQVRDWNVEFEPSQVLQTDLFKPSIHCVLDEKVINELKKAVLFLGRLNNNIGKTELNEFKDAFQKRYESKEVPLVEILDSELGIGYPVGGQISGDNAPLLLNLFGENAKASVLQYDVSNWTRFLISKYTDCLKNKELVITISLDEVEKILPLSENEHLPDSFYTLCSILSSSSDAIDRGDFKIIHEITGGPSACDLLSRFCYLDETLSELVLQSIKKEEATCPDAIYAEIVHVSHARLGNIVMRPKFRDYEIPIISISELDNDHAINLSDLFISVRNNKILLRSKNLNREVIPRLTTAHNFSLNPLPQYKFLCDLQFQNIKSRMGWDWNVLEEFDFLPRVQFGKVILTKARWVIRLDKVQITNDKSDDGQMNSFVAYIASIRLPKWITLTQGDNQLPLNLQESISVNILFRDLKKSKILKVEECLQYDENLFVFGKEGKFTNEVIIPWYKEITKQKADFPLKPQTQVEPSPLNQFHPGSSWYYVKIYCGVKTADRVLSEIILPIAEELIANKVISKWFYIRYADPEHHIRLRFEGFGAFYAIVTQEINKAIKDYLVNNLIWKIQVDTYSRETERYGSENIENSELIFYYDSLASAKIISLLSGDIGDELRWQFALKGVNDILNVFGFDLRTKRELMFAVSSNFQNEFNYSTGESKKQLGSKFRDLKEKVQFALQETLERTHDYYVVWELFAERTDNLSTCADYINFLAEGNKLSVSRQYLVTSYIHMFLNRFLRSKQRLQEMVIYDLLHQHYRSLLARESKDVLSDLK